MGTIDISYLSLGIGLLLLLIPLFYIWKFKTGLLRATLIGTARMIVQLFFIGIYLKYLFLWNNPWINFLWVIVMILVASQTALARTQLKRKILLIPISVGFLCSVVCVGMYFIGIVLRLENVFSAQYFIPIFGILMGNMLSSNVIALNTYYLSDSPWIDVFYYQELNYVLKIKKCKGFPKWKNPPLWNRHLE